MKTEERRTHVITGASGRTGQRIARGLLAAGRRVRAVGRDAGRLEPLRAAGAELVIGDVRDQRVLDAAFAGADSAYLLVQADRRAHDYRREYAGIGEGYARALERHRVGQALYLSTLGAGDPRHRGLLLVHNDVERALGAVPGLDLVHLRAPAFFENLAYFMPASRARGALATPIDPDVPLDMAATADVAEVALRTLLEGGRGSRVIELVGREPLSMRDIAARIAAIAGRLFPAVRVARGDDIEAMVAAGAGRDFAHLMNDTWDSFGRAGAIGLRASDAASVTTLTATTSIDDYVRDVVVPSLPARRHVRIAYTLRPDVDLARYEAAAAAFVAGLGGMSGRTRYGVFRLEADARSFVHVGAFDAEVAAALGREPFFQEFTAFLRQSAIAPPDVQMLTPVATTG